MDVRFSLLRNFGTSLKELQITSGCLKNFILWHWKVS
uniref:Uncharacterized protein n=1 Tax=Cucumis melo TaxID=3656 RepID=A0A9I9CI46_CUCME